MAASNIKALIPCELRKVWNLILDIENYGAWRSDLSKIEIISDKQFIEYTRDGNQFHRVRGSKEMVYEALCEIIFEKAAGTVCCGYKKRYGREIIYERYDWLLRAGLRKMRCIHSDCQ